MRIKKKDTQNRLPSGIFGRWGPCSSISGKTAEKHKICHIVIVLQYVILRFI